MLGSIQSRRCYLGSCLALTERVGRWRNGGGGRSRRDWAIDSERLGIGGAHRFLFSFDAFSFSTVTSDYATFTGRSALWFSW